MSVLGKPNLHGELRVMATSSHRPMSAWEEPNRDQNANRFNWSLLIPGAIQGLQFDFFQDADDLAFAEFWFLHGETPLVGILYSRLAQDFKEASKSRKTSKSRPPTDRSAIA